MKKINLQNLNCVKILNHYKIMNNKYKIKNILNKIEAIKIYKIKKINHNMQQL